MNQQQKQKDKQELSVEEYRTVQEEKGRHIKGMFGHIDPGVGTGVAWF